MAELLCLASCYSLRNFIGEKYWHHKIKKEKEYVVFQIPKIEAFCLVNQKSPVSEKCSNSSMKNGIKIIK